MDIREIVADLIFIVRAPVDGINEAIIASSKYSKEWRRIGTLLSAVQTPWVLPRGYRRELVGVASTYFSAGSDPSITFMALYNKYTTVLNQWVEWEYQALSAVTAISIMMGLLALMVILGAPPLLPIVNLALVPILHYYQISITIYDYRRPSITGLLGGVAGLAIGLGLGLGVSKSVILTLIGGSIGFSIYYIPQFLAFIRNYTGLPGRVLSSFGELLTVHNPRPPKPLTIIERELRPLWDYAYSVGVREFIERVNMLIDYLLSFVRRSVTTGIVFGPFTVIGYIFVLFTFIILHSIKIGFTIPINISPEALANTLIPLAVSTSILTGKAIHSIGLGIVLIPLFLLPIILMTW